MIERELERLAGRWRRHWPGADVATMVVDVRARLEAARLRWGLSEVAVLGGGEVALVCSAVADRAVVLKVHPRGHGEDRFLRAESVALEAWQGRRAVPDLHGTADDRLTMLMERLQPGRTLDSTGIAWEQRLRVIGGLVARLHSQGSCRRRCRRWPTTGPSGGGGLAGDPATLAELEELLTSADGEALLHADLHGGNALEHHGSWLVIDPHAVRGDRHADVWALVDPLAPPLPEGAAGRELARHSVAVYAAAANLDPARAARWARLRALTESTAIATSDSSSASADEREWAERARRFAAAVE